MRNIILSGIKHSGKSTVGRFLVKFYGCRFEDLDDLILAESAVKYPTVRELYKAEGADRFRFLEAEAARRWYHRSLGGEDSLVLALGGGTMENKEILGRLKETGLLVFIDMPADLLFERIMAGGRPPFLSEEDPRGDFMILYEARREMGLENAEIIVKGAGKSSEEIAREIGELVRSLYVR
jgi:shikimate kinase